VPRSESAPKVGSWHTGPVTDKLVAVVGQGYVGLAVSVRAVEVGYRVVGLDVDEDRIARLRAGESYVEDVTDPQVRDGLSCGRFVPSSRYDDVAGFDIAVITVPTPLREGLPDLSLIEESGRSLAPHLRPGVVVVLESTTYPGTTEELLAPILEAGSGLVAGVDFHLGYSPERIDPGNGTFGFVNIPKVVSGVNATSLKEVQGFYDTLTERTVVVSSCQVAELTKLLENTFRHVNVALVNEVAMFAHDLGINVWEAIDASSTKPFGYMRFTPGPGVGGHCLPVDPSYLSWQVKRRLGTPFRFVELANDLNSQMPDYVVRRISALLNGQRKAVNGSRILLLGLAYKKNSGDARESPAVRIANLLIGLGADVCAVDPHVTGVRTGADIRMVTLTADTVKSADIAVVLTDHDAFDYALTAEARLVLDTRNRRIPGAHVLLCRRGGPGQPADRQVALAAVGPPRHPRSPARGLAEAVDLASEERFLEPPLLSGGFAAEIGRPSGEASLVVGQSANGSGRPADSDRVAGDGSSHYRPCAYDDVRPDIGAGQEYRAEADEDIVADGDAPEDLDVGAGAP
jgi:nucleotide sugar dehydrogenase